MMHVYMMANIIYAACPDIPSVTNLNPKHSITDQWWGFGPLAPHQDHYNIYTSYTFSATGSKPGHYTKLLFLLFLLEKWFDLESFLKTLAYGEHVEAKLVIWLMGTYNSNISHTHSKIIITKYLLQHYSCNKPLYKITLFLIFKLC